MFHVKHEGWTLRDLSPAELSRLDLYEELLRVVAVPRGMVAASDADHLRDRHILDSLRAVPLMPSDVDRVCDLGSGAGLPGIPVAVARKGLEVTLVEPRRSRAAFLELVVDRLELANAIVCPTRAEHLPPGFDVCLARGFADIQSTWSVAERLLGRRGRLMYWAGRSFDTGDIPDGARLELASEPGLESGGPIVIMARQ